MRVYHFLPAQHAVEDIEKRQLKIAQLDDMNDPFELISLDLSDRDLRKAYRGFVGDMAQRFGVICFSKNWRNPVLWSHYADKHRGVCLGFDVPDQFLMEVNYAGERLSNKIRSELAYGGLNEKDMQEILTTKFKDWEYEDEVRVFLSLEDRDPETGFYFKTFCDELLLRQVILGSRCSVAKTAVAGPLAGEANKVEITKARMAFTKFEVVRDVEVP